MRADRGVLFVGGAVLTELGAAVAWQSTGYLRAAWLLHAVSVLFIVSGLWSMRFSAVGIAASRIWTIASVLPVACVPFFGPVLIGFMALIWRRASSTAVSTPFIDESDVYHGDESYDDRVIDIERDVMSIIRGSDPEKRRRAILGVRSFEPVAAVPVLQRCLQDSDELVRIFAQGTLQTLNDNLEGRVRSLREELKRGDLTDRQRIDLELQLAEAFHEQVYIGLVEEEKVRRALVRKSHDCIERILKIAPDRLDFRFMKFRYLIGLREVEAAEAELEVLAEAGYSEEELMAWRCELSFLKKDWTVFLPQLRTLELSGLAHGRLLSTCSFWQSGEVA